MYRQVTDLRTGESLPVQQTLRIASHAESYRHVAIQANLYLYVPRHESGVDRNTEVEMQLIQ